MNGLNINYRELENVGAAIAAKNGEFAGYLNQVKSINEDLKESWKGMDADKYLKSISEQAQYMDDLVKTVYNISDFLKKVSAAYEQAMQDNASAIN